MGGGGGTLRKADVNNHLLEIFHSNEKALILTRKIGKKYVDRFTETKKINEIKN